MLDAAFKTLGLHRSAPHATRNRGSWGVMQTAGHAPRGAHAAGRKIKGAWRTRYLYAVLADEYLPG